MAGKPNKMVALVPWDPENETHYLRMYDQRMACSWGADEIGEWRGKMLAGTKFMYWIVLDRSMPNMARMLHRHMTQYPNEKEALVDSATRLGTTTLTPSRAEFVPVGHIGLERFPERDERLGLPLSTYWVKSFYVSWVLHSSGLGRHAMDLLEEAASSPPFNCTVLALDTVTAEFQKSEEFQRGFYDDRGLPRPEVVRTNEEWYLRGGYEMLGAEAEAYEWTNPARGGILKIPNAYFKKKLGAGEEGREKKDVESEWKRENYPLLMDEFSYEGGL